ncbi:hypothetical protein [Chitinophaga sp. LS1]|uniref:hypothetical protein n=1 Tax=Chitinophaga sp. LS1 TaxID=3051176 RepID=UPI002AAACF0A|nr:hypothetical protein [Chitinophaga sp. LS1]WPV66302.1 hypothetical protein QQL36_31380 [Chitinophaga sp. LS1]
MKIAGDEPACPVTDNNGLNGLTIRQEFAARFMAAMIIANNPVADYFGGTAAQAVEAADALINALNESE